LFRPTVNYAEQVLSGGDPSAVAFAFAQEGSEVECVSLATLRAEVGATSGWLSQLKVGRGDLVVGYLPNVPEAITAFLATAAIGAIWSGCSPTLSAYEVAHRYLDFEPAALIGVEQFRHGGDIIDRREEMDQLRALSPHLRGSAMVPGTTANVAGFGSSVPARFKPLDFDHPLLMDLHREQRSASRLSLLRHGEAIGRSRRGGRFPRPKQKLLWAIEDTNPDWGLFASCLASSDSVVLRQGDPLYPNPGAIWELGATTGCTSMVVEREYVHACREAGLRPASEYDLDQLESVIVRGSDQVDGLVDWIEEQARATSVSAPAGTGAALEGQWLRRLTASRI
jgi:acetoacetyl-CoA synthetase